MKTEINRSAITASQSLKNGDQTAFAALYKLHEVQAIKLRLQKQYNPQIGVLNKHDLDAIFDDAFLECVLQYDASQDFLANLQHKVKLLRIDRYREEKADKRIAVHLSDELVVTGIGEYEENERQVGIQKEGPENVESEAFLNLLCEQLEPNEVRLVRALAAHDISRKSGAKQTSLAELADECGFRNRQQAHRFIEKLREMVA